MLASRLQPHSPQMSTLHILPGIIILIFFSWQQQYVGVI